MSLDNLIQNKKDELSQLLSRKIVVQAELSAIIQRIAELTTERAAMVGYNETTRPK